MAAIDIVMPQLGETVTEGTVTAWHKKVGDRVERDETLFDVATDKVDTEVPAPAAGVITAILVVEGATVAVGTKLAVIDAAGAQVSNTSAKTGSAANPPPQPSPSRGEGVFVRVPSPLEGEGQGGGSRRNRDSKGRPLSPVVRRIAQERGVDPGKMDGSGAGGRVTRKDLEAGAPAVTATADERIPFSRIRKLTAEHMLRSKATSPHVLQAVEAEFHRVDRARVAHGEAWRAREGFALTYLPFVARAACLAIADFPRVNASVEGETLVVHRAVNLGIAVDLGLDGLVAPVIRAAASKSVPELARAIHGLASRARKNQLGADDYAGGTYTISNSGSFGTLITAPIINQPQVAILSTDGVKKKPVVVEGPDGDTIAIRPVGVIAQSFDHRAIDGAYSAAFLRRVKEIVETRDWIADFG